MSCFADGIKDVSDFLSGIFLDEETAKKAKGNKPNASPQPEQPTVQNPDNPQGTGGNDDTLPCEKKLLNGYFAQKTTVKVVVTGGEKTSSVTYTVKRGDILSKIAGKYTGVSYQDIAKANGISAPYNISVGQKLSIPKQVATKKKTVYKKITKASLGAKVFLVVKTKGFKSGESVSIALHEKSAMLVAANTPLPFLKGTNQQHEVIAQIKIDPDDGSQQAVVEIALRPKAEKKSDDTMHAGSFEAWKEKFKKTKKDKKEKKDYLWLKVTSLASKGEEKEFLRGSELEFEACNCNTVYDKEIRCTRYNKAYGPIYRGNQKLQDYAYWDDLIKNNKVTLEEKEILVAMSANEGNLDSVQSYDSEILTAGAMQKTINLSGKGEFSKQVAEFKNSNRLKYEKLFEDCGWIVENDKIYYQEPCKSNSKKITGIELKKLLRKECSAKIFGKKIESNPIGTIVKALKDKDFQAKQITDFIDRLNTVLSIKPIGYSYTLNDYLKSKLGKATVLDQHINRPAYVDNDFGEALNYFFGKYPLVDSNPNQWGNKHTAYEKIILNYYGKHRRGTDMQNRYNKLLRALE